MTEYGAYSEDPCHGEELWPISKTERGHCTKNKSERHKNNNQLQMLCLGLQINLSEGMIITKLEVNTKLYEQSQPAISHQKANYVIY